MSVGAIFKKYPKEIVKRAVVDESDPFYKDIVLPCLKKNAGSNPEAALIREICHIPKEKLSANDLRIFISACRGGAFPEIVDGSRFTRDLVFQCVKENNEELLLLLLDQEITARYGGDRTLSQEQIDELFNIALEKNWKNSPPKLAKLGADVNKKDASGKTLVDRVLEDKKSSESERSKKLALLFENGAVFSRSVRSQVIEWLCLHAMEKINNQAIRNVVAQDPSVVSASSSKGKMLIQLMAFRYASEPSNEEIIKIFEELLEITDKLESFRCPKALEVASLSGHVGLALKILRADKTNVLPTLAAFNTLCLQGACSRGSVELADVFLKRGADPNVLDRTGHNAFHYVINSGSKESEQLALLLQRYGGDSHIKDGEGCTPALTIRIYGLNINPSLFPLNEEEETFVQKKLAGHVSTVNSCKTFEFEYSHASMMSQEVADSLKDFFLDENEETSRTVREKLVETFELGAKKIDPETIAARIQSGEPTVVAAGWKKHSIDLVFLGDDAPDSDGNDAWMAICQKGDGLLISAQTIHPFRIKRKNVTADVIKMIVAMSDAKTDPGKKYLYETLPEALSATGAPAKDDFCKMLQWELKMSFQKGNHCTYVSHKAALRFLWAALLYKGQSDKTKDTAIQVRQKTKRWSLSAQLYRLDKFTTYLQSLSKTLYSMDEILYLTEAYRKIKKRMKKTPGYAIAQRKLEEIAKKNRLIAGFLATEAMDNDSQNTGRLASRPLAVPLSPVEVIS